MVTVARRSGCLTYIFSYFQLFEPCKRVTGGWEAILHQSHGRAKWSVTAPCSPFLEETSERDEFWRPASANAEGPNGPNRKSLAGCGEIAWRRHVPFDQKCLTRWSWFAKILNLHFFVGNHWCRSVTCFCNVSTPYRTLLSEKNCDFSCFLNFFLVGARVLR